MAEYDQYGGKIGRNSPCPCGSGVKLKKCHGRNEVQDEDKIQRKEFEAVLSTMSKVNLSSKNDKEFAEEHGLGNGIVSLDLGNCRVVAVGDTLHFGRSDVSKYFPDFLSSYVRICLGDEWVSSEFEKPFDKQHQAVQWLTMFIQDFESLPIAENGSRVPTGAMMSWLRLGYDLYQIKHNSELQENLINRIKHKDQFQGARFELLCTATLISAGYSIQFENESDMSSKHPEFIATNIHTGERVAVEAKSKHRPGILGFGKSSEEVERELFPKTGVETLVNRALKKKPELPYIVFVDLNLPIWIKDFKDNRRVKELDKMVEKIQAEYESGEFPATQIVFVNDISYHSPRTQVVAVNLWAYAHNCQQCKYHFSDETIATGIAKGVMQRTNIPSHFPEYEA